MPLPCTKPTSVFSLHLVPQPLRARQLLLPFYLLLLSTYLTPLKHYWPPAAPDACHTHFHRRTFALAAPIKRKALSHICTWPIPSFNTNLCSNGIFSERPPLTAVRTCISSLSHSCPHAPILTSSSHSLAKVSQQCMPDSQRPVSHMECKWHQTRSLFCSTLWNLQGLNSAQHISRNHLLNESGKGQA